MNTEWRLAAWVIEPHFDDAALFSEGLAAACIGGKYGFIDHSGAWVIEPQYDGAESFIDGTAKIWNEQKHEVYLIDKAGNIVEYLTPDGLYSP